MNNDRRCQIMRLLMPPTALSHIILRIEDGTISHASAKIVFDEVYQRNRAVLSKLLGVEL